MIGRFTHSPKQGWIQADPTGEMSLREDRSQLVADGGIFDVFILIGYSLIETKYAHVRR